jgi:hypothetical protein
MSANTCQPPHNNQGGMSGMNGDAVVVVVAVVVVINTIDKQMITLLAISSPTKISTNL